MFMTQRFPLRYLVTVALLAMSSAGSAAAQNPNIFERVLVPISVSLLPGAYGTIWSTELWYRNNSNLPVVVIPLAVSDYVPTIGLTVPLPIGSFPAHAPGQILYVSRAGGDEVQFDLRLFNRADPQGAWGTKLPVVRESEFADVVSLINIPTGAEFRSALRVYGLPDGSVSGETVRVRIYAYDEQLMVDVDMPLKGVPRYGAILSLTDSFPELRQVDRVRVHAELRSGGAKIWAFASVVANSTQSVSIVTPE